MTENESKKLKKHNWKVLFCVALASASFGATLGFVLWMLFDFPDGFNFVCKHFYDGDCRVNVTPKTVDF